MNKEQVIQRISEVGLIPVIRAANVDEASRAIEAVLAGGIPVVEITMTVPGATSLISKAVQQYGNCILTGAGTVLTADQARACLDAGAEFVVGPGLASAVLQCADARGKLAIPGALSPTEVMQAIAQGAQVIKIFPCGTVGGPNYLKALKGPFPDVAFVPTGGVNASNAAAYLEAGAFALGIGGDLVDVVALREGNADKIISAARRLVQIVDSVRGSAKQASSVR